MEVKSEDSVYYVLWDCETQSELWRGTTEEYIKEVNGDSFESFGGGTYCVYTCMQGYSISRVFARARKHDSDYIEDDTELQMLFIQDEQPPFEIGEPAGFESYETR